MKALISAVACAALLLGSSALFAEQKYGPVLKVKPQGVTSQPAGSNQNPGAARDLNQGQSSKPTGLLLPAVQKAHEAAPRGAADTVKGHDQKAQGALDRDIIRQIPSKPKPKPKP